MLMCDSSSSLLRHSGLDLVGLPQWLVYFAGDPKFVHQHREFSGDRNHGSLLGVLPAALHQAQPPAAQVAVWTPVTQDVMRAANQQAPHHMITCLGNRQLRFAGARVTLSG